MNFVIVTRNPDTGQPKRAYGPYEEGSLLPLQFDESLEANDRDWLIMPLHEPEMPLDEPEDR